ncbi:hypothetical protein GS506_16520 [Rhodococcus hoagii]|nr:hypothetical protein [Prescottella equi]
MGGVPLASVDGRTGLSEDSRHDPRQRRPPGPPARLLGLLRVCALSALLLISPVAYPRQADSPHPPVVPSRPGFLAHSSRTHRRSSCVVRREHVSFWQP